MAGHRMHLKGPWECQWIDPPPRAASGNRVKLPASWQSLFESATRTVEFRRRFGCPTNLDASERVFLVFDGVGGAATIALNGDVLGRIEPPATRGEFPVTGLLEPRNELAVRVTVDDNCLHQPRAGLFAPVALEIRVENANG